MTDGEHGLPRRRYPVVRVRTRRPLRVVELITGALVLAAAGLGLAGPVAAAVLIHRSGAAREGIAVTTSMYLGLLAVVLTLGSAIALLALAWHRAHPAPAPAADRPLLDRSGLPAARVRFRAPARHSRIGTATSTSGAVARW